jgi:hypothetical protein
LRCWGDDRRGVGKVQGPDVVYGVQVAVGLEHTCVLEQNGSVVCSGLGIVAPPPPNVTFMHISSGSLHVCGILEESREVQCFGRNMYGESNPPDGVMAQIACGTDFCCGIRPVGRVECWGNRIRGTKSSPAVPFVQITASPSYRSVCGLTVDGDAVCWGEGIAHGEYARKWTWPFSQIIRGGSFACGLAQGTGELQCFLPGKMRNAASRLVVSDAAAGDAHICALNDGSVVCVGADKRGVGKKILDVPADLR